MLMYKPKVFVCGLLMLRICVSTIVSKSIYDILLSKIGFTNHSHQMLIELNKTKAI